MARRLPGRPVAVDERSETMRLSSYDCDRQWKPEQAGTDERPRRAAHPQPDWERVLEGSRIDPLTGQRWSEDPRPSHVLVVTYLEKKVELFPEHPVSVG